jgi:endonuclease-3 related protein
MVLTPEKLYKLLDKTFGNLDWWPIDTEYHRKNNSDPRFEIIVGTVLTQNTAWANVEKALSNLKEGQFLDISKINKIDLKSLNKLIKPSGFFNQKAKRLKILTRYLLEKYHGNLDIFFQNNIDNIRQELLNINGIGPETADSIILYAGNLPIFVVDAYTKRLCKRLPMDTNLSYKDIQLFFQKNLSEHYQGKKLVQVYNKLHALIVNFAKNYCKKKPECANCPLLSYCKFENKNL